MEVLHIYYITKIDVFLADSEKWWRTFSNHSFRKSGNETQNCIIGKTDNVAKVKIFILQEKENLVLCQMDILPCICLSSL